MIIVIAILVLVFDRVTKLWALKDLVKTDTIEVIKGFFNLTYVENRGAAFGILQGNTLLLGIISILLIVFLFVMYKKSNSKSKIYRISLGLIFSGAIGNLYDRFVYKFVVDFLHFHYKDIYHFPVFNVADISVVIGTVLLMIYFIFIEGKEINNSKHSKLS